MKQVLPNDQEARARLTEVFWPDILNTFTNSEWNFETCDYTNDATREYTNIISDLPFLTLGEPLELEEQETTNNDNNNDEIVPSARHFGLTDSDSIATIRSRNTNSRQRPQGRTNNRTSQAQSRTNNRLNRTQRTATTTTTSTAPPSSTTTAQNDPRHNSRFNRVSLEPGVNSGTQDTEPMDTGHSGSNAVAPQQ